MKPSSRMMCAVLAAVFCLPTAVTAQSPGPAVDLVVGAGSGRGGEFGDRFVLAFGIAIALRPSAAHATSIGVFADAVGLPRGDTCVIPAGGGRCPGAYPNMSAVGIELGRSAHIARYLDAELFGVLGGSWFDEKAMRAMLVGGGVRVVGRIASHVAMVVSVRELVSPNTTAGTLWVAPVTVGIRLR
jgi:hypothetical protein